MECDVTQTLTYVFIVYDKILIIASKAVFELKTLFELVYVSVGQICGNNIKRPLNFMLKNERAEIYPKPK